MAVYVLAGYSREAAHEYAKTHLAADLSDEGGVFAEDLFLAATPEDLAEIEDPSSQLQQSATKRAKEWLAKRSTALWVKDMNYKGVAPSSADIIERYIQTAEEESPDCCLLDTHKQAFLQGFPARIPPASWCFGRARPHQR